MTGVFIEPLDVLLFRDGRPFAAGTDHLARSVFPPFPPTLAGFVRSRLLEAAGLDWGRARVLFGDVGGPDGYGEFRLTGMFLRWGEVDYVPVPADVVRCKHSGNYDLLRPMPEDSIMGITSNFPVGGLRHLWTRRGEVVEPVHGFVSLDDLYRYCLTGQVPSAGSVLSEYRFVAREPRTHIGIDHHRRVASEGRLFTVEYLRLVEGTGFHVRFDGVRWPGRSGLSPLGGERPVVRWEVVDGWEPPSSKATEEKVGTTGRFKIVLLTPAVFDSGWQPGRRFAHCLQEFGVKALLVGAAVGRAVRIGGFDLHRRTPKPMRAAVPAGSVYFYEVEVGDGVRLARDWGMRSISDHDAEAGMGITVIGGWDDA